MALANQIGLTGKVVSERHYIASQTKLTAGDASKMVSKSLGIKVSAKELVESFKSIYNREPEWHHSGFYKSDGKSTMGRTFFFSHDIVYKLIEDWPKLKSIKIENEKELIRQKESVIKGVYYIWESDRNGFRGKKRNFKVLKTYEGSEFTKPQNFIKLNDLEFEKASSMVGKKYIGWDEPSKYEFN